MNVSIALATYNGGEYLQEQLDSFLRQTVMPDELVVCDDASSDDTHDILKRFKSYAPFNVDIYINDKTLGYAQNFSKALSLCRGQYVFLSDQDDSWCKEKIETAIGCFNDDNSCDLIIHDLDFCDYKLIPTGERKLDRIQKLADPMRAYVTGMATVIKSDFLEVLLPIPDGVAHDEWLHECAALLSRKRIIADVLSLYRRHENNATLKGGLNGNSQFTGIYLWAVFFRRKVLPKLSSELVKFVALEEWLGNTSEYLVEKGFLNREELKKQQSDIAQRIYAIKCRKKIFLRPRVFRLIPAVTLYARGGYSYFRGAKSFLKDVILK